MSGFLKQLHANEVNYAYNRLRWQVFIGIFVDFSHGEGDCNAPVTGVAQH